MILIVTLVLALALDDYAKSSTIIIHDLCKIFKIIADVIDKSVMSQIKKETLGVHSTLLVNTCDYKVIYLAHVGCVELYETSFKFFISFNTLTYSCLTNKSYILVTVTVIIILAFAVM